MLGYILFYSAHIFICFKLAIYTFFKDCVGREDNEGGVGVFYGIMFLHARMGKIKVKDRESPIICTISSLVSGLC